MTDDKEKEMSTDVQQRINQPISKKYQLISKRGKYQPILKREKYQPISKKGNINRFQRRENINVSRTVECGFSRLKSF